MSLATLHLPDSATEHDVKTAYRRLAALNHPDRGGDEHQFHLLHQRYLAALKEVAQPLACQKCNGSGYREIGLGWQRIKLPCLVCFGSKTIPRTPQKE